MAGLLSRRQPIEGERTARRLAASASDQGSSAQRSRMRVEGGVVLDAGAFIAAERREGTMVALIRLFAQSKTPLVTSAGVVAQVWRGGGDRHVPVAFLLKRTTVVDLSRTVARTLGRMLGESGAHEL